jgi:hypothetical protein
MVYFEWGKKDKSGRYWLPERDSQGSDSWLADKSWLHLQATVVAFGEKHQQGI